MANNNITHTPNYNLATVALDQDEVSFGDFRDAIAGTNNSNMQIIDGKMKDIDDKAQLIADIEVKVDDIETIVDDIDTRVANLEQNSGGGNADYTKVANALITTTEMADLLTIQPNPNDTSFHGLTIYGNTPSVVAPTITVSGKNIIPGNFAEWESGEYSASTGAKATSANRVRLKELLPVSPHGAYFFTTNHNTLTFIARGYDQNKDFVQDISIITNGTVKTIANNVHFIGLMIYASSGTAPVFGDYQQLFANGNIKPFACFNSIPDKSPDKSYEPYVGLQSVTLGGITLDDGDHIEMDNGVVTSTIGGVSTDITATTNGQALLGLHGYDVDTVIQMSGGAMVGVKYNRDIAALGGRVASLGRKSMSAAIATTETADTLTIDTMSPDDTSFHGLTIYGNTPSVVAPTITVSGKNLFNAASDKIYNGTQQYSPTTAAPVIKQYDIIYGMTGNGYIDSRNIVDVSYTNDFVALRAMSRGYGLAVKVKGFIPGNTYTKTYTAGAGVVLHWVCWDVDGSYIALQNNTAKTLVVPQNTAHLFLLFGWGAAAGDAVNYTKIQIESGAINSDHEPYAGLQSVTLDGITLDDGDHIEMKNGKVTLTIGGVSTNITATTNGQALLDLHGYDVDTVIQMSGGASGNIRYNLSGQTIYDMLIALLGG